MKTDPVEIVAQSRRGMMDAVRQALSGAATRMGGLDRCDATIKPQILSSGSETQFEIKVSVTKRNVTQQGS